MNILIAPDSFKESMTAKEVSEAIRSGWLESRPQDTIWTVPVFWRWRRFSRSVFGSNEWNVKVRRGYWSVGRSGQAKYALSENKTFLDMTYKFFNRTFPSIAA